MSGDLRAAVEGLADADDIDPGYPASPDYYAGYATGVRVAASHIPEGAVLVTEEQIRDALMSWRGHKSYAQEDAAAILRHLREGT